MKKDLEQDKESALLNLAWLPYALLIFHYWVIGDWFLRTTNVPHKLMDLIVRSQEGIFSILTVTWQVKLLILFLILLKDFVYIKYSGKPVAKSKLRKGITLSMIGLMLFWGSGWILTFSNLNEIISTLLYISLTVFGLLLAKRSLTILVPMLDNHGDSDHDDSSDWGKGPGGSPDPVQPLVRKERVHQRFSVTHQ